LVDRRLRRCFAAAFVLIPAWCAATDVSVVGVTPGRSADVVIDQREPITIEEGQTVDGVTVRDVNSTGAVVRVDGVTKTLPLTSGAGGRTAPAGGSITLTADGRGQFFTPGTINGRSVRFIVDTGATYVALSRVEAARIGLDYRQGRPATSATANGVVRGWIVSLASVRVADVMVRDVTAMVIDGDVPGVLLGMSFLGRFDIRQEGAKLVLRRNRR
jgi:aspartyl protease family protein